MPFKDRFDYRDIPFIVDLQGEEHPASAVSVNADARITFQIFLWIVWNKLFR
jgi:hypothetical protein